MPRAQPSRKVRKAVPRWKRRKEARPAEIVAAALELFVERGFAATRLEEVARRAGVTKGTLYLYFASKEALFKAVVRETIVPAIARAEALAARHTGTARALFEELVRGMWREHTESALAGIPKLITAEAGNFPELARFYYEEVVKRGHEVFASVLRRGVANGEFRPVHVPSAVKLAIAPLLHAAALKQSILKCVPESFDAKQYIDTHITIFLDGVRKAPVVDTPHA